MVDAEGDEWQRRYDRSLDELKSARDLRSFGPQPEQEPPWFSRRSVVPFALRRDHVAVSSHADQDVLAHRSEETNRALQGFVSVTFDGDRLVVRTRHWGRGDYLYPVFDGRAVERRGEVAVRGVVRPAHWAWPSVIMSMCLPIAALLPHVANRILLVVVGAVFFVSVTDGLILGRKRNRRRRALIVKAVEEIGGGVACLQPRG